MQFTKKPLGNFPFSLPNVHDPTPHSRDANEISKRNMIAAI